MMHDSRLSAKEFANVSSQDFRIKARGTGWDWMQLVPPQSSSTTAPTILIKLSKRLPAQSHLLIAQIIN
jgi:hypothetical protein